MQLTIVFLAFTVFLLITALLGRIGRKADQINCRLSQIKNKDQNPLNEELKKPLFERLIKPILQAISNNISKLFFRRKSKKTSKARDKTIRQLRSAEINIPYEAFILVKLSAAVLLAVGGYLIAKVTGQQPQIMLLAGVLGLVVGVWIPMFIVKKKIKVRNASILHDLPEVMDLLVVSVEAGLGLDAAILRLYEKNKSPLLEELMSSVRDVQMGLPRKQSLKAMGDRCEVQELRSFASSMIQAEQLGVSIKNVLHSQSDQLRLSYRQRCEAKAMKAPVKMMIPMVMFIFPVLFIILLGPSVTRISGLF